MKQKRYLGLATFAAAAVVTAGFFVARNVTAGPTVRVGRPCYESSRPSLDQVNHALFDALLRKYVDGRGMVAYAQWKSSAADLQALDRYLAQLGCVDLRKSASKAARLAYWINAYNAVTIKGILREYPTTSIRNHTAKLFGYNIWNDLKLWVDGTWYSLNDIEHRILRKMGEPRIHFAINCASMGCPPLANRAYTAQNLEQMLSGNARAFFANRRNFQADPSTRTVYVSQLLQWYGRDFAPSPQQQIRLLRSYLPNPDRLAWLDEGFSVRYLNYDWSLNDQARAR